MAVQVRGIGFSGDVRTSGVVGFDFHEATILISADNAARTQTTTTIMQAVTTSSEGTLLGLRMAFSLCVTPRQIKRECQLKKTGRASNS